MKSLKKTFLLFTFFYGISAAAQERPRILIIGDSVYNEISRQAALLLKDRSEVIFTSYSSFSSSEALANFDKLIQGKKWDLIHFNFGMNDLMYRDPTIKEIRAMHKDAGGVRACSPQQYEKNLRELVSRFKATGSKVVWASTTPIVGDNGVLVEGSEVEYNQIAAKVMNENNVPINDMYSHGLVVHKSMAKGHGKTFSFKGGKAMHPPVVNILLNELKLRKTIKGPVKVYIMAGGPLIAGQGFVSDTRKPRAGRVGTLDDLVLNTKTASQYGHLHKSGKGWTSRSDVWVSLGNRSSGALSIGFGQRNNMIGPELGFGHVMGGQMNQQVLIYKPELRDPALSSFFTKNGSYKTMMSQIEGLLNNLHYKFPDYTEQTGFELSGVILAFGRNEKDEKVFATNLSRLLNDIRKDMKQPKLPVILLGVGLPEKKYEDILKAQQSIASQSTNVNFLDSRPFWPDKTKSPDKSAEKWYGNAESFYRIGAAIAVQMQKMK